MNHAVYIGYDPREKRAWNVCARSLLHHAGQPVDLHAISRITLGEQYRRPTSYRESRLWDDISGAPMATDFSLARFWAPFQHSASMWVLFVDGDFLFRANVHELFAQADRRFAVQVVKHQHAPVENLKMDGQIQTVYERKNWSSCMLIYMRHAGWNRLTDHARNTMTGLSLHQFAWLKDHEIGEITPDWNVLDGEAPPVGHAVAHCGTPGIDSVPVPLEPKAYHFTRGTPDMVRCAQPYENEWWSWLTEIEYREWRRECAPAH